MNWFTFLFSLTIGYVVYYVLNILYDLYFNSSKFQAVSEQQEIVLPQPDVPIKVTLSATSPNAAPNNTSVPTEKKSYQALPFVPIAPTGGLNIKDLVLLMQSEVIEYTKAIPY